MLNWGIIQNANLPIAFLFVDAFTEYVISCIFSAVNMNDPCGQTPAICLNGATCVNTTSSYNCSCAPGYTGTHCEQGQYPPPSPAPSSPLLLFPLSSTPDSLSPTCINTTSSYNCTSALGYTGTHCEQGQCPQGHDLSPCDGLEL